MTENVEKATKATKATKAKTLDDAALGDGALDKALGGAGSRFHTGGRFQLEIGNYSVGYLKKS